MSVLQHPERLVTAGVVQRKLVTTKPAATYRKRKVEQIYMRPRFTVVWRPGSVPVACNEDILSTALDGGFTNRERIGKCKIDVVEQGQIGRRHELISGCCGLIFDKPGKGRPHEVRAAWFISHPPADRQSLTLKYLVERRKTERPQADRSGDASRLRRPDVPLTPRD